MAEIEILPPDASTWRMMVVPDPLREARHLVEVPVGTSLEEAIAQQPIPSIWRGSLFVSVQGDPVPMAWLPRVRPKQGSLVAVIPRPQGGGNSWLRIVGMIAIVALAVVTTYLTAGALAPVWGATLAAAAGAAAGAVVSTVGMLALNALVPPAVEEMKKAAQGDTQQSYRIEGGSNESRPFGVIPKLYGRRRVYPFYAAKPYGELRGDDQYYRFLFTLGYGPNTLSDFRIGTTPLSSYTDWQLDWRAGWQDDAPIGLFTTTADEESVQVQMQQGDVVVRTSPENSDEIVVELYFQYCFATSKSTGDVSNAQVQIRIERAPAGTSAWVNLGEPLVNEKRQTPFSRAWNFANPYRGKFDVRVTCLRKSSGKLDHRNDFSFSILRSFTHTAPVTEKGQTLIALVIKASDQISGTIDKFNCIASSFLADYDGASNSWIWRESANPAAVIRDIWTGTANARPMDLSARVDLPSLQAMANLAAAYNLRFHGFIDAETSVGALVDEVAKVGRGMRSIVDGKWSVALDDPNDAPVWLATPRVTTSYSSSRALLEQPHGYRAKFTNEAKDWASDELVIYSDGYDASNATRIEDLEFPYVTDPDRVYRDGRYMLAQALLRSETHILGLDWESLRLVRGDRFLFAHDSIKVGSGSGRVKSVTRNAAGACVSLELDDLVFFTDAAQMARRRRADGVLRYYSLTNRNQVDVTVLNFATPIPADDMPEIGDLFAVGVAGRETLDLRVKTVRPESDFAATIEAAESAPGCWAAETGPIPPFDSLITERPDARPPAPITGQTITDERVLFISSDGTLLSRIWIELKNRPFYPTTIDAQVWRNQSQDEVAGWRRAEVTADDKGSVTLGGVEDGITYTVRLRYLTDIAQGPWSSQLTITVIGKTNAPSDVTGVSSEVALDGVRLSWAAVPDRDLAEYEISQLVDGAWIYLDRVRVTTYSAGLLKIPRPVGAQPDGKAYTFTFGVVAVDTGGRKSLNVTPVTATVTPPPVPRIASQVLDNFVNLSFPTSSGSFLIDRWRVKRGPDYTTAQQLIVTNGPFYPVFEFVEGSYTYWVKAIDTAGNVGLPARLLVNVAVPVDFNVLEVWDTDFSTAVITNGLVNDDGALIVPVDTAETWQQHFQRRGWQTIQDQLNAGYPYFLQPTPGTARLVQVFDYGVLISNTSVSVQPTQEIIAGDVTAVPTLESSEDGTTWNYLGSGWNAVIPRFRYLRLTVDYTGADDKALALVDYTAILSVRYIDDSGRGTANAADAGGTQVLFNRAFIDVDSLQVTPSGTEARYATWDFQDVADPVGFKVLLWSAAGQRVSGPFSWTARGIG